MIALAPRLEFLAEVAAAGFLFRGIAPAPDGSFMPDDAGREACVLAVHYRGEPVDAVAWFTDAPRRWWTLRRTAELLGERSAFEAEMRGKPLLLVETPHRWLQAWGDGCACILDWGVDPRQMLTRIDHVACESEQLAVKLRAAIERHNRPAFRITIAARGVRHVA
jgi:hypothetical protein